MRIKASEMIDDKIMDLLDIKHSSSMVNSFIDYSIKENSVIPGDVGSLRAKAVKVHRDMQAHGISGHTDDEIMLILMVESMIAPFLCDQPDVFRIYMNSILNECRVFDTEEFMNDPYIKNIDVHEKHQGDYELLYHEFMPYELFI